MISAIISNVLRVLLLFSVAHFLQIYFIFYISCVVMLVGTALTANRIRSGNVTRVEAHKMNYDGSNLAIIIGGVICTLIIANLHISSAIVCFIFHFIMSLLVVDIKNSVDKFLLKHGLKK